jgi:probable phosphoglycerate mutase
MVVEVVLVQHAEKEKVAGDAPLTAVGHEQARRVAQLLSAHSWDRLFCSPLLRARQTAAPIGRLCGLDPVVDERLRERMNWGDGEVAQSIEKFLQDWQRASLDRQWQPPSGASSFATGRRMQAFLDDIASVGSSRTLAVTHGGATVDLLRNLLNDAGIDTLAPGVLRDGVPNCALTQLVQDGSWRIERIAVGALPSDR